MNECKIRVRFANVRTTIDDRTKKRNPEVFPETVGNAPKRNKHFSYFFFTFFFFDLFFVCTGIFFERVRSVYACSALPLYYFSLKNNRGGVGNPYTHFPEALPWSVPEGSGAMATASCVLDAQDAPVPPVALLGLAGAVLASLGAVTMSKWCREVSRRRAASARASRLAAAVSVEGSKAKLKRYPEYTIDTVRLHSSAKDAWVVVGDGVYDVTKWAPRHPGGERNIIDISGRCVCQLIDFGFVCGCQEEPRRLTWD